MNLAKFYFVDACYYMESIGISLSYLLDLIIGDPSWFPHPVKGMGKLIIFLEERLKNGKEGYVLRIKGILLAVIVVGVSATTAYMLLYFAGRIDYILKIIFWIILGYMSLATKDLFLHVKRILERINSEDIEGAREKLSFIVGRDTQDLSKKEVIRACIESIAENTNDGIIAPLFYLILGGPTLAIGYKAINTLDSMVGYKNQDYKDFGWFSAKLDDFVNFIPARITGILIVISSFLLGYNFKDSFRIMCRDGRNHLSPNSGIPEAAMAGALGIRVGGLTKYKGKLVVKPYIGEDKTFIGPGLINKAIKVSFLSSFLMVLGGSILRWVI